MFPSIFVGVLLSFPCTLTAYVCTDGNDQTLPCNMHPFQNISLSHRYFFARKVVFVKHSMGYICMPGGFGTFDEFFEALTLLQTNKIYPIPIVLFGIEFWQGLLDWLTAQPLKHGLISAEDLKLLTVTDDIEEVVSIMVQHRKYKMLKIRRSKTIYSPEN